MGTKHQAIYESEMTHSEADIMKILLATDGTAPLRFAWHPTALASAEKKGWVNTNQRERVVKITEEGERAYNDYLTKTWVRK